MTQADDIVTFVRGFFLQQEAMVVGRLVWYRNRTRTHLDITELLFYKELCLTIRGQLTLLLVVGR